MHSSGWRVCRSLVTPRAERADDVEDAWWARPASALLEALGSSAQGLRSSVAEERFAQVGPNVLGAAHRASLLGTLVSQLRSPLVLLLVVAALISALVREWTDAGVVLAIVLGSVALATYHEARADHAVERLRARVRVRVTVVRDGREIAIPSDQIVPGDVVRLAAGTLIPGDGVLLEANSLFLSEAVLTGESFPVEKRPGTCGEDAPISARLNAVFLGGTVRNGSGTALIVRTGSRTELGRIAHTISLRPPETGFEAGLRGFGALLMRVMIVLTLVVLATNILHARPAVDALLFALALAVGISPELLPAILSVTLARGATKMAERDVIVKRLAAIEDFGAMDVLCTDKTGTLTEGVIRLDGALTPDGAPSDEVLALALVNASLQSGLPSPLDEAIRNAAASAGITLPSGTRKVHEIPYDFARKRLGVIVDRDETRTLIVKGAVSNVLDVCDAARRAAIEAEVARWNDEGWRVLAVATRTLERSHDDARYGEGDERGLVLRGFLRFLDPPKQGAADAVRGLRALGVQIKILSGDARGVAVHVAGALGIPITGVITGSELRAMHDDALWHRAPTTTIFAELDPSQKERVIAALRKRDHVVGYLGDGINDAPAMHAADVAISVEGAVDVAKDAADIVLGQRDLDVLRVGVEAGRTTFANTLKYVRTTTSANFGNMVTMALASVWLPFLPLTATQILLNNFLSDVPQSAVAGDAVDRDVVERPAGWDLREIREFMIVFGLVSTVFDLLLFAALRGLGATVDEFRTVWFVESLVTELGIAFVVRTWRPAWRSRPSRALTISTLVVLVISFALPYAPFAPALGMVPLAPRWIVLAAIVTVAYLVTSEIVKQLWRRRRTRMRSRDA
ncbi:magnesium-translocating P-type ATPase [Sandaracinus amylolyticus]|uniref:magnesium-translocating P-type ATPase n=1 Tax=Sandaracinus amylolyticus TaxID=927083 RepID=UPI001F2AD075|nr:magnesium-translocating P-type ATPase [Sandaracinus amylolyticus]UJR84649.1 Hypothetical protein I5071_67280 [Sandaracinus amylolyticus]